MLKSLHIHNLVLIETADICFEAGFNVITGETGSGKSALLHALALVMGERSDFSILRHGAEKGYVEATFEIDHLPSVLHELEEAGINHEKGSPLLLKRELKAAGKTRILINHQTAQLHFLRQLGTQLVSIINQHDCQSLFDLHAQRKIVDLFGETTLLLKAFQTDYQTFLSLSSELHSLRASEAARMREIEVAEVEIEEIDQAHLQVGEEEILFTEFALLSNAEERASHAEQALQSHQSALSALVKARGALEKLQALDIDLIPILETLQTSLLDIEENTHTLRRYSVTANPERLHALDLRLNLLNRLKKKYGDPLGYRAARWERLQHLTGADQRIAELEEALHSAEKAVQASALRLTTARFQAAEQLGHALTLELQTLHMPHATCSIALIPETRTAQGDERLEIYLRPNLGEKATPARETASGGELARLLLAIHTLLAGKRALPTLVFDEIDANIGGTTATLIGTKLRTIASRHQILCITHFAQVAAAANHHLYIQKGEYEGRTHTLITRLSPPQQETELARMRGELSFFP